MANQATVTTRDSVEAPPAAAGTTGGRNGRKGRAAVPAVGQPAEAVADVPHEAYSDYAPPVVESERNDALRDELIERLRLHFASDPMVYIWGDLGVYYEKNRPRRLV